MTVMPLFCKMTIMPLCYKMTICYVMYYLCEHAMIYMLHTCVICYMGWDYYDWRKCTILEALLQILFSAATGANFWSVGMGG